MNLHMTIVRWWHRLSITSKFSLSFAMLLGLILTVSIISIFMMDTYRRTTEISILTSRHIGDLVQEMDAGLEKARRLQRDFFLRYPQVGFEQAQKDYAVRAVDEIDQVLKSLQDLRGIIGQSESGDTLQSYQVDLNLYQSSAQRYKKTFLESVDLVEQLASSSSGLLTQLDSDSNALLSNLTALNNKDWIDRFREMQIYEKDYLINFRRSTMQSAINIVNSIQRDLNSSLSFSDDQKRVFLKELSDYASTAGSVVELEASIHSKFNDFDLQAQSIDPISNELLALANSNVDQAQTLMNQRSEFAIWILIVTMFACLGLATFVAVVLNQSVTRNIVKLTDAAGQLKGGQLDVVTKIDSEDELGVLAQAFNLMAAELRKSFSSLQASETRYRTFIEDSPVALWEEDFSEVKHQIDRMQADGINDILAYLDEYPSETRNLAKQIKILDVNRATLELLKYPDKRTLIEESSAVLQDIPADVFVNEIHYLIGNQEPFSMQSSHRDRLGREIQIVLQLNLVPGYEDNWSRVLISMVDITDREQALLALIESENRFRIIFNSISEAIIVLTEDGSKVLMANQSMCNLFGYQEEELLGHSLVNISADSSPYTIDALSNWFGPEKLDLPQPFEWLCKHKSGQLFWVDVNRKVVQIDRQERMLIVLRDISERKRAEDEILTLNSELEQRVATRTVQLEAANKELEAFAYSVSHDLRAPLRSMDGFSKAVLEDYGDLLDEEGKTYLHRIRASSQYMGQLIDALLNLSRVTRSEMQIYPVDLSRLSKEICIDIQSSNPDRLFEFVIQDGLVVEADLSLMRIMMANLLGNAAKFTMKKSTGLIEFGVIERESEKVYFVRDNGAGFDMTYSKKLFGTFQRLHNSSEFEGTGIGLALVKRIVQRHGGRIWAEGVVDRGATFYFTLARG